MKMNFKVTFAAAVFAAALPTFASAEDQKSIVLDSNNNAVTTREGVCVTHNFPAPAGTICEGNRVVRSLNEELMIPNVVYFDFDKSKLNSKGKKVLEEVAAALQQVESYNVKLSGHTDTVASGTYNQALSEKRAEAVRAALVEAGIDAAKITTEALGESVNAVPTKDSVPEALNRRVEIAVTN